MTTFIILPNQLFENNYRFLKEFSKVFIIEEPYYFSGSIKPNKIKVAYLRACMRYYYEDLRANKINVIYITFDEIIKDNYLFLNGKEVFVYELTDFKLQLKYKSLKIKFTELETLMFIMNHDDLKTYDRPTPAHASFYEMAKQKLGILKGIKNQDVYNRKNPKTIIDTNIDISYITAKTLKYYKDGIEYANTNRFKEHIGNPTLDTIKIYPITSFDAYKAFNYFLENNFINFGNYQDVIQDTNPFMYHAIISPMLNNGLLLPLKLIKILENRKQRISLSSYEGFVRQIIGWREYMRYLYLYKYDSLISSNKHKNYKTIDKSWYSGTTGIIVLDTEIKKAITYGYAHHIIRLMIFLNFLILSDINPNDIYKWFMEVVSIDAYDWVMVPNIYSMGNFSGIGMKRAYLSSSNYILKMSNYKKDGKWDILWTDLFRSFVKSRKLNFYLRSIK